MVVPCAHKPKYLGEIKSELELSSKFLTMSVIHLQDQGILEICVDIHYI